jgi:predicted porin
MAMLGAASVAHAQSSVTLYGIIDAGIAYTHNNAVTNPNGTIDNTSSKFGSNDGTVSGDRWGLKGTEDLGSGLQAVFSWRTVLTWHRVTRCRAVANSVAKPLSACRARARTP